MPTMLAEDRDTTEQPKGVVCSLCGSKMRVTHTKPKAGGVIVRYRKCVECDHTDTTEEKKTT